MAIHLRKEQFPQNNRKELAYSYVHDVAKRNIVKNFHTDISHDVIYILTTEFPYFLVGLYASGSHIEGRNTLPTVGVWEVGRHLDRPVTWLILDVERKTIEEI